MNQEELLDLYIQRLRILCLEKIQHEKCSVIEALKASILFLEGEMQGY